MEARSTLPPRRRRRVASRAPRPLPGPALQRAEALQVRLPQRRRSLLVFLRGFLRCAARRSRLEQPTFHVLQLRPVLLLNL